MSETMKYILRRIMRRPHLVACLFVNMEPALRQGRSEDPTGKYDPVRPYGDLYEVVFTDKNDVPIADSLFEWSRN